jgi:hypothetical protein
VVFIGPYEHHSNELPWRESIADVVTIDEDADGRIDLDFLERQLPCYQRPAAEDRQLLGGLQRHRHRQRHRGDLGAAAPHGALAFWDFAAAAPYVEDRDEPGPGGRPTDTSPTRTRSSSRPTSSSAAPARRACWW